MNFLSHNNYANLLKKLGRPREAEEHYGPSRGRTRERSRSTRETPSGVVFSISLQIPTIIFDVVFSLPSDNP